MTRNPDCIFCKIVAAELPASVVYEDESLIAFLDINPLAEGHLLVLPREHHPRLTDLPPALCGRVSAAMPMLARALMKVTGAEGFNLLQSNGRTAGQVVDHVHFHLIPRDASDELGFRWNTIKYEAHRADEIAASLQAALARHGA